MHRVTGIQIKTIKRILKDALENNKVTKKKRDLGLSVFDWACTEFLAEYVNFENHITLRQIRN